MPVTTYRRSTLAQPATSGHAGQVGRTFARLTPTSITTTPTVKNINLTPNSTTLPRMPTQKTVTIVKTVRAVEEKQRKESRDGSDGGDGEMQRYSKECLSDLYHDISGSKVP